MLQIQEQGRVSTSNKERKGQVSRGTQVPDSSVVQARGSALTVPRRWVAQGQDPYSMVEWEQRSARLSDSDGKVIFEQEGIDVPVAWSQTATNIVVQKYFRGAIGSPQRENSVRQLVGRVVDTITRWGRVGGYFASDEDALSFHDELAHLLVTQRASFNSPVWFNVGVEEHPQCSACFINSVQDSMSSILTLAHTEGMLFKYGSGTGSNLSSLRSSREQLVGGGLASGPVSFMRGFDAFAGVIKSGGKTRRAAKMVILNADHPDVRDFATCKAREERKAWALIDAGYDGSFGGEAYASVFFQNANHSVRVTDAFMEAVTDDADWDTHAVVDGRPVETFKARALWREIIEAAHQCGDPGLQFDTTINLWHTCKTSGRINASNPCSEYMFLDDSACNLASLNLMKFRNASGEFDAEGFRHAVSLFILAQEILCENASYPTPAIGRNSHDYRPLGLGFANLGALLMAQGLPYDSDGGRAQAAAITALMTGQSYATSAELARARGPFAMFVKNRKPFIEVVRMHRHAVEGIDVAHVPAPLLSAARRAWDEAVEGGEAHGLRNSQVTVLAPTGTIGFMMDCDTTGIEPDIALVKYKKLVGGGQLKIVNHSIPETLQRLGYDAETCGRILAFVEESGTVEGCPELQAEHLPAFDCAFRPAKGTRSIEPLGHVRMMGAVQPFLSGAISKTVNLPNDATIESIGEIYQQAWRLGLKSIAIYRDGSKRMQPVSTGKDEKKVVAPAAVHDENVFKALRQRLPDERLAVTHKFSIGGHEGYMTVGLYESGNPGELFVTMSKEGSTISGFMDGFATAVSLALQYGVPLKVLIDKFSHARFEPSGFTGNPHIPFAKSITDYIFRWMGLKFLPPGERPFDPTQGQGDLFASPPEDSDLAEEKKKRRESDTSFKPDAMAALHKREEEIFATQADAPPCSECGSIMVRSGACYKCLNCGSSSGCS
ncbi:MAG: vitamin B12-dependent ribonucleotide reductase [Pseudomonadota bacterium]